MDAVSGEGRQNFEYFGRRVGPKCSKFSITHLTQHLLLLDSTVPDVTETQAWVTLSTTLIWVKLLQEGEIKKRFSEKEGDRSFLKT